MTPREFLEQVVRPAMDELNTNYASVRHAPSAVAIVDALAAHVCVWCVRNALSEVAGLPAENRDSAYRAGLAHRHPDFALLRDIAKVQKHVHLTNPRQKPRVTSAAQVAVSSSDLGEFPWGEFPWDGSPQVAVTTDDGGDRSVLAGTIAAPAFFRRGKKPPKKLKKPKGGQ